MLQRQASCVISGVVCCRDRRRASRQMQPAAETGVERHVRCSLLQRQASCVTSDATYCRGRIRASRQMQPAAETGVVLRVRCSLLQRQASCFTSDVVCCRDRRRASRHMQPAALIYLPAVIPFGPTSCIFCVTNKQCTQLIGRLQQDALLVR